MSEPEDSKTKLARRDLLSGAVTLAACSLLTDCGFTANSSGSGSSGAFSSSSTASAPITLAVTAEAQGSIPARFMGLSYEKTAMTYSYFHASNYNLIALFRLLGNGVLRIGGGSVDLVTFSEKATASHTLVTPFEITALAAFLEQTGWQCIYGVNFAASTPDIAAQEVAYVASALGPNLLGIEIGNEPDEYSSSGHFFVGNWTFQDFIARWELFRAAIASAAPGAPITGPAAGGGNHITMWTLPFAEATGPPPN